MLKHLMQGCSPFALVLQSIMIIYQITLLTMNVCHAIIDAQRALNKEVVLLVSEISQYLRRGYSLAIVLVRQGFTMHTLISEIVKVIFIYKII